MLNKYSNKKKITQFWKLIFIYKLLNFLSLKYESDKRYDDKKKGREKKESRGHKTIYMIVKVVQYEGKYMKECM